MKEKIKFTFFKSLRFRIMVILVVIGIVPSFIVKNVVVNSYETRAVSIREVNLKNQCDILGNQLMKENYLREPDSDVINGELSMLSAIYNGRILIINKDAKIIKDTYDIDVGKYALSEEVIQCFEGKSTANYDDKNAYIEMTSPITKMDSNTIEGVMLVSISTSEIEDSIDMLENRGNLLLSIICILVLVFGYLLAGVLVKPFSRVTKAIEDLTDGYLDEEISVPDYTETELITNAFNKMLGRMKTLDESRQKFVSNVSHELKTPLTSMKVLADSLIGQEDTPVELYREFMSDIGAEIDRENKIINDLLSLVKMDKAAGNINIESVNINELLERIMKRLKPIAQRQNVELVMESFRPVVAEVDEVKLTLALSNLIENGIKYNNAEGWVHVTLNADHQNFFVTVEDNGIGIPKEAQTRIFERFYRVDKSHSREIGGTGLGLAIARNAIIMHRGAIKVHSLEGEGTTFTVRIPLTYIAG